MLWQLSAYGIIIWLARYPKIRKAKQQLMLFGIVSGSYFVVSRQECRLNAFYLRRPRCILGITWRDRAPRKDPNWSMLVAPLSLRGAYAGSPCHPHAGWPALESATTDRDTWKHVCAQDQCSSIWEKERVPAGREEWTQTTESRVRDHRDRRRLHLQ